MHTTPGMRWGMNLWQNALLKWRCNVSTRAIAFDPYRIKYLVPKLDEVGDGSLTPHGQGFYKAKDSGLWMPHSIELFEQPLMTRRLRSTNPCLRWNAASAVLEADQKITASLPGKKHWSNWWCGGISNGDWCCGRWGWWWQPWWLFSNPLSMWWQINNIQSICALIMAGLRVWLPSLLGKARDTWTRFTIRTISAQAHGDSSVNDERILQISTVWRCVSFNFDVNGLFATGCVETDKQEIEPKSIGHPLADYCGIRPTRATTAQESERHDYAACLW